MQKQGGSLGEVCSWAMASEYFSFDHQHLFWYWCQLAKESLYLGYARFALISEPGTSQVVVLIWLWILETALGKRIVLKMKTLSQCFFFQFCDVATLVWLWKKDIFSRFYLKKYFAIYSPPQKKRCPVQVWLLHYHKIIPVFLLIALCECLPCCRKL
jgi:hypothetical protein